MAQHVRRVEQEIREEDQEDADPECILDRVIGVERDLVLRDLCVDAQRVVRAVLVQCQDMQDHDRSEEHTSELKSLMRNSYAVFCEKKRRMKKRRKRKTT